MRAPRWHQLSIAAIASLVFFLNLGQPRLWDDDEPRNAQCAREMLDRGELIVPTFNQELRTDKPALLYWLMIAAYSLLGVTELAARFWSALLAVGTALLTYQLGRMLFSAKVGFWAGLAMASSLMFGVTGRAATPDSTLVFFTTLSLLAYVGWAMPKSSAEKPGGTVRFLPAYAAMGFAVLAKGPVGVVLPLGVIVAHLWSMRPVPPRPAEKAAPWRRRALRSLANACRPGPWLASIWSARPLTGLALAAAIALPWYVAVGLKTDGAWLAGFLGKHNLDRFLAPIEHHSGPIVYYLAAIIIGFFPWSVFLPLAAQHVVRGAARGDLRQAGYRLVVAWIAVYVGFFSLAGTKLPSYVVPAYPALALGTAAFVRSWLGKPQRVSKRWLRAALASTCLVGVGLLAGLPIAAGQLLPGEAMLGLIGIAPLAGGALAWLWAERGNVRLAGASFATAAVLLVAALHGVAAVRVSHYQNSQPLVAAADRLAARSATLATHGYTVPSLVYYANRRVPALNDDRAVRDYFANQHDALLVTTSQRLAKLQDALPPDATVLVRQRRFLRQEDVVILGRPTATAQSPSKNPIR